MHPLNDPNLWQIVSRVGSGGTEVVGYLAVYVDDMLIIAPEDVIQHTAEHIQSQWRTSPLEMAGKDHTMKFCGMELEQEDDWASSSYINKAI